MPVFRGNWILLGVRAQPVATTTHTREEVSCCKQRDSRKSSTVWTFSVIKPVWLLFYWWNSSFRDLYQQNSTCFYESLFVCRWFIGFMASVGKSTSKINKRETRPRTPSGIINHININFLTLSEKSHNVTWSNRDELHDPVCLVNITFSQVTRSREQNERMPLVLIMTFLHKLCV